MRCGWTRGCACFMRPGDIRCLSSRWCGPNLGQGAASSPEAERAHRQSPLDDARALPPRVHAVLVGRLLQLSPSARAFVELAATIGRAFTLDLLIAASNADAESAVHALDELWHKRIVREHGANSYDFTHDKLREVAYAEISAPQRRLLHRPYRAGAGGHAC